MILVTELCDSNHTAGCCSRHTATRAGDSKS